MIVISAQNIHKAFILNKVLTGANLVVQQGERIGLVGVNGSGKSTLMKIIMGEEAPDEGRLFMQKCQVGYLSQQSDTMSDGSLFEEACSVFAPIIEMESRLRELERLMAENHEDEILYKKYMDEYHRVTLAFEQADGYEWRSQAQGVLIGLGFKDQFDRGVSTLSGGERTRLSLAKLLLVKPDILLLDEPTNHLDLNALSWLEDFLSKYKGTVLVISHDRYFLDAVCTGIAELQFGGIAQYNGNYSSYLDQRVAVYEQQLKTHQNQQKEIERQRAIIARYKMYNTEASLIKARSREKHVDKLISAQVERPDTERNVYFTFKADKRTGVDVLITSGLSKEIGGRVLYAGVDIHIRSGERVAVIGPNGTGKSTLIREIIAGLENDDSRVRFGANVEVGYYDQYQSELHPDKTVLDELWDDFPKLEMTDIRNALAAFLLTGDDVFQKISTLSGGEKARVMLAKLMLRKDNFLILDEPTNHLDMDSREMLESALRDYTGTIFAVSHDRYFINHLFDRILEIENGTVTSYVGNWDDYLEKEKQAFQSVSSDDSTGRTKTRTEMEKEKRRTREQKDRLKAIRIRITELEKAIETAETEFADLETKLADSSLYQDSEAARLMAKAYNDKKSEIETLYDEWARAHEATDGEA